MAKFSARLLLISLLVLGCSAAGFCGLTITSDPTEATANSVWNLKAVWTDDTGLWPLYMPDTDTEIIQPDPGGTISREYHEQVRTRLTETERDVDDTRIGVRLGVGWSGDLNSTPPETNDFLRMPYPKSPPPNPITEPDPENPNVTITTEWSFPLRGVSQVDIPTVGFDENCILQQVYIPRHEVVRNRTFVDNKGTPEDPSDDTTTVETTTWFVPPVIVCRYEPDAGVQVNFASDGSAPYTDVGIYNAGGAFCLRRTVTGTQTAYVLDSEPVWTWDPLAAPPEPAPPVRVIVLDPYTSAEGTNPLAAEAGDNPEDQFPDANRVFVTYERVAHRDSPNTSYVQTDISPLPRTHTFYAIPVNNSIDGSVKLRINKGILQLDPNRTQPNDADPRYPDRPGIYSPILGIFEEQNLEGTNYFVPGNYTSGQRYDVLTIPKDLIPEDGWQDGRMLYVAVSTFAVDAVWTRFEDQLDPRYPKRINYFRQPEWMSGVISRPWPTDDTAYEVKPDIDPKSIGMRAVTGIFLPQIMTGSAIDRTHVVPQDQARVKTVLGVFALLNMDGTRFDRTHVVPASPIPEGGFVSAIYAIHRMNGTPVDPRHVTPANASLIYRVRHVYIGAGGTDYYDSADPFQPGDAEVALSQDLPPGTSAVTIEYETFSLYDPDNPELRFTSGDTMLALNNPLPEGASAVRIVYGVGTGLDGFNYYDPNNTMTNFRADEPSIALRSPLPEGTTDVRILYGTDEDLTTRGVGNADGSGVIAQDMWTISRVKGVWAILDMDGVRVDDTHVQPFDPLAIKQVLGVYAVDEIPDCTVIDQTHVGPPVDNPATADVNESHAFLSIRRARAVYALDDQTGTPVAGNNLRVTPSDPDIIGRVLGVYDNEAKTGTNYFDPDNPETVFRTGDTEIALSTPLPTPAPATAFIYYETVNLVDDPVHALDVGDPDVAGDESIVLGIPLPADVLSIRAIYVDNANLFDAKNPVRPFTPGDTVVTLNTPLPAGTIEATVVYVEARDRYRPPSPGVPDYAPGEAEIPLLPALPLPADAAGAVIDYSAHLFSPSYDPHDYDPKDASTLYLRPFIPGDTVIRLNRLDPLVALPSRFTGSGALKLCIAYQSNKKVPMGTYTTNGTVYLPIPLPEAWRPVGNCATPRSVNYYIDYRPLSSVNGPKWDPSPAEGPSYTLGRPYMGYVTGLSFVDSLPTPPVAVSSTGKFSYRSPLGVSQVRVTYRREEPDAPGTGVVWVTGVGGSYYGRIPMYYVQGSPITGAEYRVAVSAGLNMSNPLQQPNWILSEHRPTLTNRFIFDPRYHPMWYAPGLVAEGHSVRTLDAIGAIGYMYKSNQFTSQEGRQIVKIHDSRPKFPGDMIDYGGNAGDLDSLTCYPETFGGIWPTGADVDPLSVEPVEETNPTAPDDGSSSTEFVFRVRYHNEDGLPPKPWLHAEDDQCHAPGGGASATGVVLYLDEKGTGDYRPHFMHLERPDLKPEDADYGRYSNVYMYRIMPHHALMETGNPLPYPLMWGYSDILGTYYDNETYASLGIGVYHYFFGCSDDSLAFDDGSFPFENQSGAGMAEWGEDPLASWQTRSSSGLDPSLPRAVTGYGEINRPAKRRYTFDGLEPFDSSIFVDRPCRVPGLFEEGLNFIYPWKAEEHPKVTCELRMPVHDDLNIRYDDKKYGEGRFMGTLELSGPNNGFYRAANPAHPGSKTGGRQALLAETCGSTSGTDHIFRILWKQIDNKPPIYIRVMINNASEKTGTTPGHTYTGYTMYPRADQVPPYNYRNGVWYEYKTKLPPGPHTYYFQAYDGEHVARFPNRPDRMPYHLPDNADEYNDWWVPTSSLRTERGTADYFDNDYFPGPYVNNPCVLSDPSVSPGTGKEGQSFKYRVKYTDPDGQRVYSAFIYIQTNDRGDVRKLAMRPETPLDPGADNSALYKQGVYFVLDTGTLNDLALEKGVRRYYFEFTDDWGRQLDVNDTIKGETTRLPAGAGNWISGPIISGNNRPTLTRGSVASQDGTANAATLWTFRVTYRDANNDAPTVMKLYIGELQPDGKTILWNEGHSMLPSDPANTVYVDGVEYYFQTRLGGVDTVVAGEPEPAPKQYFYAFEAYDGVDWAIYKSSSNEELRSNAAGFVLLQDAERLDATHYRLRAFIAQQGVATSPTEVTPENPSDILRVVGVFLNEDLFGATYYNPNIANPPFEPGNTKIVLTSALPAGTERVWIKYEAQSPIVGPLPIDLPAPAGIIPDAQIFKGYASNPVPMPIDDQKNGWISPTNPEDRGTMVMSALAIFEGQPSRRYVTPADARDIASVEGVYLYPDFSGENYYDPDLLEPPISQTGVPTASDPTRKTVTPSEAARVAKVLGVYTDPDFLSENYYLGEGYPNTVNWQPTVILGSGTVWMTNPSDVISIKGVYTSMDTSTTNYYRPDGASVQLGGPGDLVVQPSDPGAIAQLLGVYLSRDAGGNPVGDNYYDPQAASPPYSPAAVFIVPTTPLPGDTITVQIQHTNSVGETVWQTGTTFFGTIVPNDSLPIGVLQGVFLSHSFDGQGRPVGSGRNYYDPARANPPYVPGSPEIVLTTPIPRSSLPAGGTVSVIYTNRGVGFGPEGEYIGLAKELDLTVFNPVAFVAYFGGGSLDPSGNIKLSKALPEGVSQVYIKMHTPTFNPGDTAIPLTKELPEVLHPSDPSNRLVYVKYSDIRFTHQLRGSAHQPLSLTRWVTGATHYSPDGWTSGDVRIKGNMDDVTAGVVGVWLNPNRENINYFDPRRRSRVQDNPLHLRLTTPVPSGATDLWARYYQKGDYHIDRWNREVVFLDDVDPAARVQASFFFGTKMPQKLGPNTAPELSNGKVTPLTGSRSTQYVYSVTYRDLDGPNGQAPSYVRVYIDGVPYDMVPVNTGGTPAFREGAVYNLSLPSGLTGGSHKYHFEASDGAAVAWFDANGGHQSLVGSIVESVKDLDGPWVNNPPTLSNGKAEPNPTTGGIGTNQSVDYTVVYTDIDNNPPYFHDPTTDLDKDGSPVGADVSGSPRVWIDSGVNDVSFAGTVASLQADPLDPTKKRTMVAEGSPGWSVDQFAGKLMQITDGSIEGRVYLVQSNTANTLVIATDDLEKDGVKAGLRFRINGLLMYKADPTQQDFTLGVTYKITVPKLSVGTHKFHFTARSRENKPQWLRDLMIASGQVPLPYSSEVRNPVTGDHNGPTVVSSPPAGNSEPEISNTADTSLYRGPNIRSARVDSASQVSVSDFYLQIRQVLGVYLNANEAYLASGATYHNPDTTADPYVPGQTVIKLSPDLPAVDGATQLVQLAAVTAASRLLVRPDDYAGIGAVIGVFDNPQLTGDNYYAPGTYDAGEQTIELRGDKPLPAAVKQVYVQYTLKSGVTWPRVYVRYFSFPGTDNIYLANEPLTFRIDYKDPDNDPPTYHDSVQGYIRVVFNDSGRSAQMLPLKPPVTDYTVNVPFTVTLTDVPEGSHKYHFEASDGYYNVRWPEGVLGNPAANDYAIRVNYKPVILSGMVDHTSGATTFTFTAKYQDQDGTPPYSDSFVLRLTKSDGSIERTYRMLKDPSETTPNYALGVNYYVVADAKDTAKPLPPGTYHSVFEASDGLQDADPFVGPDIKVRDTNYKPVIKNYLVSPSAGKTGMTFNYSGFYYDQDNDAPVALSGGQRVEGLTLVVDQDLATEQRLLMTRTASTTPPDYTLASGVEYKAALTGKKLGPGKHTYTVVASDGTDNSVFATGVPSFRVGPVLLVPYFDLQVVTRDGSAVTDRTVVGQEVLIRGKLYFPYNSESGKPGTITDLTIPVTKPDGTAVSLNGSVSNIQEDSLSPHENWVGEITVNYGGFVDSALATGTSLTLTASGQWKVGAVWPGNAEWDRAETDTNMDGQNDVVLITVNGPSRTVAVTDPLNTMSAPVADMITPPMIIGSPDAGAIFGYDRALEMQIVRWDPTAKTYLRYGVSGMFPPLVPGDAVWIKPRMTYPAPEPLGMRAVQHGTVGDLLTVQISSAMAEQTAYVAGVYTTTALTGTNYYVPQQANPQYRRGDTLIRLTRSLPTGTTEVWIDYVVYPLTGVDEGWIALDNPAVAMAIEGGEPRYYHTWYRLVKVLSQAYSVQTDALGNPVLDPVTKLPLLKSCEIPLKAGWNQFGNIFYNWKKASQAASATGSRTVVPTQPGAIGKLLGVYTVPGLTGTNYYVPGTAAQPYRRGDSVISLTSALPAGTTTVYLSYEAFPKEDVGIPIGECLVSYLGQRKTLADAKVAGWIHDYAWRYDAVQREYVRVSATAAGEERTLKAWSGYWIKAMVDCTLEINPNTSYNGAGSLAADLGARRAETELIDMPPPVPD